MIKIHQRLDMMKRLLLFIVSCLFVGNALGEGSDFYKWDDFSEKTKEILKSRYRIDETVFEERYSTLPKDEYGAKDLAKIFREHLTVMLEEALQEEAESAKRIGELITQQKRENEENKSKPKKSVTIRPEFLEKMEEGYLYDLFMTANRHKFYPNDLEEQKRMLQAFEVKWPPVEDYSTLKSTLVEIEDDVDSPYYTWNDFTLNTKLIFAEHGINQQIFKEKYSTVPKKEGEDKIMKVLLGDIWGQGKYFICNNQWSDSEKINLEKIPVTTTDFDIQKKVKKIQSKKKAPKKIT